FQVLVACVLAERRSDAMSAYEQLISRPSDAGVYVAPSRRYLAALDAVERGRMARTPQGRSIRLTESANTFSRLGHIRKSAAIMAEVLYSDTTYFVGLLWGLHYSLQLGNVDRARQYIGVLERMDSINPVVKAFRGIIVCAD